MYFAARRGRWPEASSEPSLGLGLFVALFTTSASMIAVINSVVAGTGVAILADDVLTNHRTSIAVTLGAVVALILIAAFFAYERWRLKVFDALTSAEE